MDPLQEEHFKQHEIHLRPASDGKDVAADAMALLTGAEGISDVYAIDNRSLCVSYDLRQISLLIIEEALQEIGIELDNSLLQKMRRAIFYYMEETQLVNMGTSHDQSKSKLEVFVNRYHQRDHGCRDDRPDYYHHYN